MIVMSKELNSASNIVEIVRNRYDIKVIHDSELTDNKVRYGILNQLLVFGMENSLTNKLKKLNIKINDNDHKVMLPCSLGYRVKHYDLKTTEEEVDK